MLQNSFTSWRQLQKLPFFYHDHQGTIIEKGVRHCNLEIVQAPTGLLEVKKRGGVSEKKK